MGLQASDSNISFNSGGTMGYSPLKDDQDM